MRKTSRIREDIMINSKRVGRTPSQEPVAGNGLIDRRVLLGHGIAIAGAMSTAGTITGAAAEPLKDPEWSLQFGSTLPPVQIASPYEKHVVRSLSNPNGEFRNSHARTPHHLLGVPLRRTASTSPSIIAAYRISTRPSTSSLSTEWCASRWSSPWRRCRATR
jgi:hypothetical protein